MRRLFYLLPFLLSCRVDCSGRANGPPPPSPEVWNERDRENARRQEEWTQANRSYAEQRGLQQSGAGGASPSVVAGAAGGIVAVGAVAIAASQGDAGPPPKVLSDQAQ